MKVENGLFTYQLGSVNPLPDDIFTDTLRWLGIKVGTDLETTPRTKLTSVAYAYHALRADTAGFALSTGNGWVDDGAVVRLADTTDNVGIGTTSPTSPLHIYKSTSATTSAQTVLQLHSASTGDYTDLSYFGPQISFRSEDNDAVNDDFEFARIAGVHHKDVNYGMLEFSVLRNGAMNRLMTLSDPGFVGGGTPAGLMLNNPTFNEGVLNVRNFNANKYVAYFESESTSEENVLIAYLGNPLSNRHFLQMKSNTLSTPDTKFRFQNDGNAYADGSWNGGGANYAEWFEKEGDIPPTSLIGLNIETGRLRVWQTGDPLIGVQSTNPGFVGNNVFGAEGSEEELQRDHVLVALIGQAGIESADTVEKGRQVFTSDGQFVGWRLSNGKVFVGSAASGEAGMSPVKSQQSHEIEQLESRVAQLEALVETLLAQRSGSRNGTGELAVER